MASSRVGLFSFYPLTITGLSALAQAYADARSSVQNRPDTGRHLLEAIPEPLSHQAQVIEHPARFKLWRAGRRTGKTRGALRCAALGHGPDKMHRGLLQGMDVAWIAPDYPQSGVIWSEDIRPKFRGVPGFKLNESERTVTVEGGGTLYIRSAEVIDGIRGIGKRLGGVVVDEGAHLDLEYALRSVIRPALMDNQGWALIMSTTNAGPDGNQVKRTPSYFNVLCDEVRAGERGSDWAAFYGTAYDNTSLLRSEVDDLVAEYADDSPELKQEIFAELLEGGVGFALSALDAGVHFVESFRIPNHWTQFGAYDWGYQHPFTFGHMTADEEGNVYLAESVHGFDGRRLGLPDLRRLLPDQQAKAVAEVIPMPKLNHIVAGHDCFQEHLARGSRGPTIAEQWANEGYPLVRANIARVAGLNNLRRYIDHDKETGKRSHFYMMDTPGNRYTFKVLQRIQVDPKNPEDALKVDASIVNGLGGDDPFDMVRYGLMSRPIIAQAPSRELKREDEHPGWDLEKRQRKGANMPNRFEQLYGNEKWKTPGFRRPTDDDE